MALLSLSGVSKSFGANELFSNISFTIEDNHRIGLVGVNGSGKTTLFKIIQDKINYDSGEIYKSKNTILGFVEQFICTDISKTVYNEALDSNFELIELETKIQSLQEEIENNNDNIENKINLKNNLEEKFAEKRRLYL